MKKLTLIFSLLLIFNLYADISLEGRVTYIQDGDTIKIKNTYGKSYIIRMWGIDAPESYFQGKDQGKHAFNAKNYLKSILPIGSDVTIWAADELINGGNRVLGRVYLDGDDLAIHLLEMGLVIPYIIYPVDNEVASEYIEASRIAVFKYLGMFESEEPLEEMPYEFRMRVRNWTPKNYIGDFYSKKYYGPNEYEKVPAWRRVFFGSWWEADDAGYIEQ